MFEKLKALKTTKSELEKAIQVHIAQLQVLREQLLRTAGGIEVIEQLAEEDETDGN